MAGSRSLALRFALVAILIGALGAIFVVLDLRAQLRRDTEKQVLDAASNVSALISAATRAGMLHNRWDDVKEVIKNIDEQPGIVRIRLMNKKGDVVLSSDPAEVGRRFLVTASECRPCHEKAAPQPDAPREQRVRIFRAGNGDRVLGMIQPVRGGPECAGSCHQHPSGKAVLGVIDTQLSLAAPDRASTEQTSRLIRSVMLVQLACALAIGVMLAIMLRRRLRPVLTAIRRLDGGDYRARVEKRYTDEFAEVGTAFNGMAGDLERSHEELQTWAHTLQDRVDEKTRELNSAQEQMVRSERLACLGRLAAVVAHELNNPLAGVQVFARRTRRALAGEEPVPPARAHEIAEWMETVDREVARCGRIVQDLLAFSRQRAPHRAPVDVNELVGRATRLLGHKLDLEEINLVLHLDETMQPVIADGGQVEQALLAVMINAVEAMPKGGVLEITTRPYAGGGTEIEVRDSGTGIDPDVMAHIFEPFFTTKPEGQGTGLGLSVVYGIVTRHGGRLDVSSAPDRGTCVTMVFPPTPLNDDDAPGPATDENLAASPSEHGR